MSFFPNNYLNSDKLKDQERMQLAFDELIIL